MFAGGLLGLIIFVLWAYSVFDVIRTDEADMRNMPKVLWLLVVILIPPVGPVAWLALGRPEGTASHPARTHAAPPPRRPLGPEDSPDFMLRAGEDVRRLRRWEEDLRRREEDLRRREEETPED